MSKTSTGLDNNVAAGLCYVFGWFSGLIFLLIEKEEIYKIDGEAIPVETMEMTLYYRQGDKSTKVSEFKPVFPDLIELKDEIEIIIDEFAEKTPEVQIQEITSYLGEFYGKPQNGNLTAWLKEEFGLE